MVSILKVSVFWTLVLFGFSCGAPKSMALQDVGAALVEKFKREAPLAWKRAKDAQMNVFSSSDYEVKIQAKIWNAPRANGPERIQTFEETFNRINSKFRSYLRVEDGVENTLIAINPFYSFELTRANLNSPWTLSQVHPANSDGNSTTTEPSGHFYKLTYADLELGKLRNITELHPVHSALDELVIDDLDIRTASVVLVNGRDMVRLEFGSPYEVYAVNRTTKTTEKQVRIADAYVVLDPSLEWAVVEFDALSGPIKSSATRWLAKYEYDRTPSGVIYRSNSLHEYYYKDVKDRSESFAWTCNSRPLSTSEFLLTNYGFPEPGFYNPPRPWWIYFSVTGMIIVAIGAIVLHFGRRMRQR